MIEPDFFNVWVALVPFVIGTILVLFLDFNQRQNEPKKVSIFSMIFFVFFGFFLFYHVFMLILVSAGSDDDLFKVQGKVTGVSDVNSGYDLYVNEKYFKINNNAFYCIHDISKLKKGDMIELSFYKPFDKLSYKCVRRIAIIVK